MLFHAFPGHYSCISKAWTREKGQTAKGKKKKNNMQTFDFYTIYRDLKITERDLKILKNVRLFFWDF